MNDQQMRMWALDILSRNPQKNNLSPRERMIEANELIDYVLNGKVPDRA